MLHSDLHRHLTVWRISWRCSDVFAAMGGEEGKKMAVLHGKKLFVAMLKVGAESVPADSLFPTSVVSNG